MSLGGVYVYRCRKPGAILGWPIIGRHFAYVGETTSFIHRHSQHMGTVLRTSRYSGTQASWSDLEPRCVLRIPLPRWKWLLRSVETLLILLLWPVYNEKKNLWNPRRIPRATAAAMRADREKRARLGIVWRMWLGFRTMVFLAGAVVLAYVVWRMSR